MRALSVTSVPPDIAGRPPDRGLLGGRLNASRQRELILGLFLVLCYGFFRQVPGWNELSRYDLVVALVDDHTTRIDSYHDNTEDKAIYGGHYYSDKVPGASLLGVPAYVLLRGASAVAGLERPDARAVIHALAFGAAGIPTMLSAIVLLRFLRDLVGEWWALTMSAAYALGTLAFPFATMYFGHAAATACVFAAFYSLWRQRSGGPAWRPLWAGFFAGWGVLVDVGAALAVGALLVYALVRDRRAPFLMAVGAMPPALLLLGYNWLSFGGPFTLGYANLTHRGFADAMGRGVLGVTLPQPAVLYEILVGPRGMLLLSPWLACVPFGLRAARWPDVRREVALSAAIVLMYLVANAGYHEPLGGWSPGPRFLTTALPFATVLVALAPRSIRPVTVTLMAWSVAVVGVATATVPNAPTGVTYPLTDLWLPRLLTGYPAETTAWLYWGLPGAQPLFVLALATATATIAVYATARPTRVASKLVGASIGLLALLAVGFGVPFDLPGSLGLGGVPAEATPNIAVIRAGVTPVPAEDGRPLIEAWAQVENRGAASEATTILFSIYAPTGERVWSEASRRVRWRERERRRHWAQWPPGGSAPGDYRVEVSIVSANQRTTFARVDTIARVRVLGEGFEIHRE